MSMRSLPTGSHGTRSRRVAQLGLALASLSVACGDKSVEEAKALAAAANPILTDLKAQGGKLAEPVDTAAPFKFQAEAVLACKAAAPTAKRLKEISVPEGHALKIPWMLVTMAADSFVANAPCAEASVGGDLEMQCAANCIAKWEALVKNVDTFRERAKQDGADFVSLK